MGNKTPAVVLVASPQESDPETPLSGAPRTSSVFNLTYSSTDRTTTTGRPCFSTITGCALAVSMRRPKLYLASFADNVCMISPSKFSTHIMAKMAKKQQYLPAHTRFRHTPSSLGAQVPSADGEGRADAIKICDCRTRHGRALNFRWIFECAFANVELDKT